MKFSLVFIGALAVFVSYLVFSLPVAAATDVSIMFNGQVQETAKYEQGKLVNLQIGMKHEPSDITWTNVKLTVGLNGASLSNSIKKIYLYKCRDQTPTECVRSTPQIFDNYVDTELLWKDISEKAGPSPYPRTANLLFLVKLEGLNGRESWAGFFSQTKQSNYNIFDTTQLSIGGMEFHAKSKDLVGPIKSYIEGKMLIPFKWASKVVFTGGNPLYSFGANSQEIDSHQFQTAVVSSSEISSISKDFYFVAPKTSSGVANPIVLNLNPSFSCGNGICESDIGESSASCCYDCVCPSGQYCDVPSNINLSSCRADAMGLTVVSASSPLITDCSRGFNANISVRISNPPVGLGSQATGTVKLDQATYSVTCSGSSGSYGCAIPLTSGIKCGGGSYTIGPGLINLTLSYKDGPNAVSKALGTSFSGVSVNYDCACGEGKYCDSVKKTCQSEDAIRLGITYLTSYLDNYDPGDKIYLNAKIFNPPAGLVLVDKSATLNLTGGQVSPGTPDCSAPSPQFEYNCSIPFQIANYDKTKAYTFQPNTLYFMISYNDGPLQKTRTISAPFGPVSIPSQFCGDGQCNMGEGQDSCCLDCGCPSASQYCDVSAGCRGIDSVTLSVASVYPVNFTDCRESHAAYISLSVNNAPTEMELEYFVYLQNGLVKGWSMKCDKAALNLLNCTLVIPPLEEEGCSLPYKTVGPNSMNVTISFPDGKSEQLTRHLSAPFQDIQIVPVYHCGDEVCESSLGESSSNCCYDCPCSDSPSFGEGFYCDFDPETYTGGCLPKADIRLVIDSPKVPVSFQSCEISNDVNIKAHIQNQPKNSKVELYYANLNGSNAEMLHCDVEELFSGSNFTLNCTLRIPSIYGCSQGKTYAYDSNSFSLLLSYENGQSREETQTLTAPLPTITIKQGIRTIYDITQDGIKKIKDRLQRTMEIARSLFDWYKDCMEMAKVIGFLSLVGAIAGGIWGGGGSSTITDRVLIGTSILQAGGTFLEAWMGFCKLVSEMYNLDMKIQEIEINMVQMEMCMEMNQHMLDIGKCEGREESCFSSMVSCVKFSDIRNSMQDIDQIMDSATSDAAKINDAFLKLGAVTGWVGGAGQSQMYVTCGELFGSRTECCTQNNYAFAGSTTSCKEQKATLHLQPVNCGYPVITTGDGVSEIILCKGGGCATKNLKLGTYSLNLYCFSNEAALKSAIGGTIPADETLLPTNSITSYRITNGLAFKYIEGSGPSGKPNACNCPGLDQTQTTGCCQTTADTKKCDDNIAQSACSTYGKLYVGSCSSVQGCLQYGTATVLGCCIDDETGMCVNTKTQEDVNLCKTDSKNNWIEGRECVQVQGCSQYGTGL